VRTALDGAMPGEQPRSNDSKAEPPGVRGADSVYVPHEREEFLEEIEEERAERAERTKHDQLDQPKP